MLGDNAIVLKFRCPLIKPISTVFIRLEKVVNIFFFYQFGSNSFQVDRIIVIDSKYFTVYLSFGALLTGKPERAKALREKSIKQVAAPKC